MAKIPYRAWPKGAKLIASAALVALLGGNYAAQTYIEDVAQSEGYVPSGYRDPVGIPTKCFGDTTDVVLGKQYSWDECVRSLNEHSVEIIKPVKQCLGRHWDNLPEESRAAIASLSYNIGNGAFCKSSVANYIRADNLERACRRIGDGSFYVKARGQKLRGLVLRRERESEMCMRGVHKMRGDE